LRAWRIYPHTAVYAQARGFDPLDGAGGQVANRWNEPGNAIIYASANPSLAVLEVLAHLRQPNKFGERTILEFEFEDDIEEVSLEQVRKLREGGPSDDPEARTRAYGTTWLKEKRSLALLVPSFVMPFDFNVLINPLHAKAASRRIIRQERVRLDARLL